MSKSDEVPRRRGRLKRWLQNLALLVGASVLVLLVLELAVRWLAPQQLVLLRPDIWQPREVLGWEHAPDLDTTVNTGDGLVRFRTDARGHRIGEAAPGAAGFRVLVLGDSFVEALQVDHEDTFVHGLARQLSAELGSSVQAVNAGVGGWEPDQYRLKAIEELPRERYDALVVFLFPPNDIVSRRVDSYPPRRIAQRHHFRIPRSFSRREWVDAVAYPVNDALETRSHLFNLLKNRAKFLLMDWGLSAHYFPSVLWAAAADDPGWDLTTDACEEIQQVAAAAGAPVLFVLLPGVYQVDREISARYVEALGIPPEDVDVDLPTRALGPRFDARGLPWLDMAPALREALAGGERGLYGRVDTHFAPAGHRVVAATVAPRLAELLTAAATSTPPEPS